MPTNGGASWGDATDSLIRIMNASFSAICMWYKKNSLIDIWLGCFVLAGRGGKSS